MALTAKTSKRQGSQRRKEGRNWASGFLQKTRRLNKTTEEEVVRVFKRRERGLQGYRGKHEGVTWFRKKEGTFYRDKRG